MCIYIYIYIWYLSVINEVSSALNYCCGCRFYNFRYTVYQSLYLRQISVENLTFNCVDKQLIELQYKLMIENYMSLFEESCMSNQKL